ncbi:MAG: aldehyde ferredoxin oxidoreductase family protein [Dehalococcoidales bacterium]|nr:aldehyde ferredoxin oxidoreductase family protein [Dehalococcoidales bacterium]
MLKGGYWGKILWVDLSSKKISEATFDEAFARKYLGGVGLATRIVSEHVTRNTNPLGPGNVLVFATGPYQAANIASAGRCSCAARAPLSGYWGEANAGGHIGPELKRAGFDAVVITGRAASPVYLWINDGKAEIRDASSLWGLDAVETTAALKESVDAKAAVSCIGPGGENLVRFACIANDNHGYFGRGGMGAVMGSKNLKALVIRGTLKPPIADEGKLREVYKEILARAKDAPFTKDNAEHGQASAVVPREENGLLPMKNFAMDTWTEGAAKIGTPYFTEELQIKRWPCPACIMGCHRRITNPKYFPADTGGPEFETLGMIGSNLLIDDLGAIVRANEMANRYTIDTIDLGGVLGWAFECYEHGLITKEDTDGIALEWGSGDALIKMTEKIARREGIGNLFAEGLRACVDHIPGTQLYAQESLGQTVGAHDPRAFWGQTITTIASTRGGCHLHGFAEAFDLGALLPEIGITEGTDRFDVAKKGYAGAIYQDIQQFWNSLTWCFFYFFSGVTLADQVNMLNAITGWDVTPAEAQKMGERIVCMQQVFNLNMGMVPEKENVMQERFTKPHKEGGAAGKVPPWQAILQEYWETKDWAKGVPSKAKLAELGLDKLEDKKALSAAVARDYKKD